MQATTPSSPYTLPEEPLTLADLALFAEHAVRHGHESGRDDDVIFMPYSTADLPTYERVVQHRTLTWPRQLTQPAWVRTWALYDDDRIVGHVDLTGGGLLAALHRCTLGMGLERSCRDAGWGGRLLDIAGDWARRQPSLYWLDLGVFAHNIPARRLYDSRGFVPVGRLDDCFRVDGTIIDDIQMTLRLRD